MRGTELALTAPIVVALVALTLVERVAWLVVATTLALHPARSTVAAASTTALSFARAALASRVRVASEQSLLRAVLETTLSTHPLVADIARVRSCMLEGIVTEARASVDLKPRVVGDALAALVATAWILTTRGPNHSLTLCVSLGCGAAVALLGRHAARRASDGFWEAYDHRVRTSLQAVDGRVELASMHRADVALHRLDVATAVLRSSLRRTGVLVLLAGRGPIIAAVATVIATMSLSHGGATIADIAELAAALVPFGLVAASLAELTRSRSVRATLAEFLASRRPKRDGAPVAAAPTYLAFRACSAAYGERGALRDVSLDWPRDRLLVLSGPNGSGKSTLLRVAVGLVEPTSGSFSLDDTPLASFDVESWRARIAYLPQRPYLPHGATVREAIHFLEPDASDARITSALVDVELVEVLTDKRPDDPLAANVDTLSSGERQRLALARILVRDADCYLLDEPDQNLDRKGIATVKRIAEKLRLRGFVVIAAHDPEVLALPGVHARLERGRIVETTFSA